MKGERVYRRGREVNIHLVPPNLRDATAISTPGLVFIIDCKGSEAVKIPIDRAYVNLSNRSEVVLEGVMPS